MAIQITFPDGNVKAFDAPPTGLAIATGISPGLAKKAVVVRVNGELWDLNRPIDRDAAFEIVTRDKPEALEVIRHDAAHVLAQAVQELFPGTQVTFGPSTEHGFYYDFARAVLIGEARRRKAPRDERAERDERDLEHHRVHRRRGGRRCERHAHVHAHRHRHVHARVVQQPRHAVGRRLQRCEDSLAAAAGGA